MTKRAALGFKLHTGWAALVAVSGHPGKIDLLLRRRIELLAAGSVIPRFVYHEAAAMPPAQAAELVKQATKASASAAKLAVDEALSELGARGIQVDVCGVLGGSKRAPDDLGAILRSHPMIHTAEGALFQDAIVSAGTSCRLRVVVAREKEVWASAAAALAVAEPALRKEVDGLREILGPPWSADHKAATAIALLALKAKRA